MRLEHITAEQIAEYGVVAAPDRLVGRPQENKAVFDRLVRELVAVAVNRVIDTANELLTAEDVRTAQETGRETAERGREAAEWERTRAEQSRITAETARVAAEEARQAAERRRESGEEKREAQELDRVIAEGARRGAEQDRVSAEAKRADENEGIVARAAAEAVRSIAQADRAKYEADRAHAIAGGDFVTHPEIGHAGGAASLDNQGTVPEWELPFRRYSLSTRERAEGKTDYGLSALELSPAAVLQVRPLTGTAELTAMVSGQEYDVLNMSGDSASVPNGTLILRMRG